MTFDRQKIDEFRDMLDKAVEPLAKPKSEFLERLLILKQAAQLSNTFQGEVRKATKKLFDDNILLAEEIGREERMSYNRENNMALEIEELTQSSEESLWLPSSWEQR